MPSFPYKLCFSLELYDSSLVIDNVCTTTVLHTMRTRVHRKKHTLATILSTWSWCTLQAAAAAATTVTTLGVWWRTSVPTTTFCCFLMQQATVGAANPWKTEKNKRKLTSSLFICRVDTCTTLCLLFIYSYKVNSDNR